MDNLERYGSTIHAACEEIHRATEFEELAADADFITLFLKL